MIDIYRKILFDLIREFDALNLDNKGAFVGSEQALICQKLFSRSVNIIENITSHDSYYCREAERIVMGSKRVGGIFKTDVNALKGHLQALFSDIEEGLLTNLEYKISAQSFIDFFDHAKYYLSQNKKMEASVIASSVFESTIRKIGKKNGLQFEKLDRLIDELKKSSLITATEMKKYKYFSGVRNEALHSNWDKFTIDEVNDLINGTEILIEKHLEN